METVYFSAGAFPPGTTILKQLKSPGGALQVLPAPLPARVAGQRPAGRELRLPGPADSREQHHQAEAQRPEPGGLFRVKPPCLLPVAHRAVARQQRRQPPRPDQPPGDLSQELPSRQTGPRNPSVAAFVRSRRPRPPHGRPDHYDSIGCGLPTALSSLRVDRRSAPPPVAPHWLPLPVRPLHRTPNACPWG